MPRVALHHGVTRLEDGVGNLGNIELLVVGLLSRDDGSIGNKGEVDTRVGHQVGLELVEIYVESTVESEGSGD